jgi:hypothetical protein
LSEAYGRRAIGRTHIDVIIRTATRTFLAQKHLSPVRGECRDHRPIGDSQILLLTLAGAQSNRTRAPILVAQQHTAVTGNIVDGETPGDTRYQALVT